MFAEVVFNLPLEGPFHYSIPGNLANSVGIGSAVLVPFGKKRLVGYVIGFVKKTDVKYIKQIEGVIRATPLVNKEMLRLTKWLSDHYFCSWGEAIAAAVPAAIKVQGRGLQSSLVAVYTRTTLNIQSPNAILLTSQQESALNEILDAIDKTIHRVFLLYGITGSGKTEVYLRAINESLRQGKSSIVLVPEISLTPQTAQRFEERFGNEVAVLHSRLTIKERRFQWQRIEDGSVHIVVGARSAIFAPVKRLGLIVVDEEHEATYKQDSVPRYHARDVAIKRAAINKAPVILGSATPSIESYYIAKRGKYKLITLTHRVEERQLPKVEIVDMRQEIIEQKRIPIFSRMLENRIRRIIDKKEQAILFLNRRGFATYINCRRCGTVLRCRRCQVVLNFHFQTKSLVCHYCNAHLEPPQVCPECHSSYIRYRGIGTEKVESEAHRFFPDALIARMDTDSTKKRGSHKAILGDFARGRLNLLVGTQMIAKGLDFPRVTLVGIVLADITLNQPDFRAAERTFDLLTQVAGRAGRGSDKGEVILQTYCPTHYAIVAASRHDYVGFYEKEIALRRELHQSPFSKLIQIVLRGRNQARVIKVASALVNNLKGALTNKRVETIGPVPAPIPRIRGQYRFVVILKGKKIEPMNKALEKILCRTRRYGGVMIAVDVEPS